MSVLLPKKEKHRPNAEFIEISMNLSILLIPLTFETGQLKQRKPELQLWVVGALLMEFRPFFLSYSIQKCKIFYIKIKSFSYNTFAIT